jgi:hypothetical protein
VQLRLASGNLATLTKERGPILGLLADAEERRLIALTQLRDDMANVSVASRSVHFRFERHLQTRAAGPARLCAAVDNQPSPFFGVLTGQRCVIHRRDNPSWTCTLPAFPESGPYAGIVGSLPKNPFAWWCLLFFADKGVFVTGEAASQVVLTFGVEAMPENPDRSTLYQPPLQGWLEDRDRLAIQWVTRDSSLYAVELILDPHVEQSPRPQRLQTRNPVLGVHGSIDRHLTAKSRMTIWDSLDPWFASAQLVNPVAAICLESGAVLIVEASGALTRVPINSR